LNKIRLFIGFLLIFLVIGTSFAEETEPENESVALCADAVSEQGETLLNDFRTFLDEYMKQDVPTSQQVDNAMKFYRYVETTLQTAYTEGMDLYSEVALTFDEINEATSLCTYRRDQYIDEAGLLLQSYVRYSANSKRTFQIIDGLKAMNEDMEDFSRNFHEAFPNKFNQMNAALPCYARGCLTQ